MPILRFMGPFKWLSNFGPGEAAFEGVTYPTSEHAYQAAKTLDPDERRLVREAKTPGKAKRLGQKVTMREDWDDVKVSVMEAILLDKFTRSPELRMKLLATGDEHLEEGNYWGDHFWGTDEKTRKGENNLGKVLMRVRETLNGQ